MPIFKLFLCALCLALIGNSAASDQKREAEIARQLSQDIIIGKSLQLQAEGKKFWGLYTETEKPKSQGAIIMLHDMGAHPNQKPVIAGLREYLPKYGWTTLSIQMPLRETGSTPFEYYALFPEALARITAAIKYAKDNGSATIVLAGYGLGGLMAVHAQSEKETDIAALITISLPVPKVTAKTAQTLEFIKKIKIPLLDIYSGFDTADVRETARDRRLAAKDNNNYRQLLINDDGHSYEHNTDLMGKRIYSWLNRVTSKP